MDNGSIVEHLNNLVVVLKDADLGFHAAAEEVREARLKTNLHKHAQEAASVRGELETLVRSVGGEPNNEGTFTGKCQRIWTEVKTAFSEKDEHVVMSDCLSAQESVHDSFAEVLSVEGLPANLKEAVRTLFDKVKSITASIRDSHTHYEKIQNS